MVLVMARYVKQPHATSCAPTSLINVGKWAGNLLTLKDDYQRLYNNTKCGPNGTFDKDIDRVLREEFRGILNVRKVKSPHFNDTANHIKNGGAALISYSYEDDDQPKGEGCHIALFTDIWEGDWVGHNVYSSMPSSVIPYTEILYYFYNQTGKPTVWLLKRKNNGY